MAWTPPTPGFGTCDCCGAELKIEPPSFFMTLRGPASYADEGRSVVLFEWSAAGDYCLECGEKLTQRIIASLPLPERYDKEYKDRINLEIDLIKGGE